MNPGYRPVARGRLAALVRAGLLTAVADGAFAAVMSVILYGGVARIFQGVASTLMGRSALTGGLPTAGIGVLMHIGVAFGWAAVYVFALSRLPVVQAVLGSRAGALKVAAVYGPCIWMIMSLLVIPALTHRPPAINAIWWIELAGHFPFVGVPIVAGAGLRPQSGGI